MSVTVPPPDLPEGWQEVHTDRPPKVIRAAKHCESGLYVDVIDISPAADLLTLQIRICTNKELETLTPVTSVSEGTEAIDILESITTRASSLLEQPESMTKDELTTEIAVSYQPVNEDLSRGHPAERLLNNHVIAIGNSPSTICPVSGEVIWEDPTHTPRVTCYTSGDKQAGWAVHAVFHPEANVESLTDVEQKFRRIPNRSNRDQLILSALARTTNVQNEEASNNPEFVGLQKLVLRQLAVRDSM